MKFLSSLLFLVAALQAQQPGFFVQISDTQLGMYSDNHDVQQEIANFEFVVANVNRLKPLFLINCGDLINKPGDPLQTSEYLRIKATISPGIPYYQVAGNHDVGNESTPESLAAYRKKFGPDYYSFQEGAIWGIVLDSSLYKAPGKVLEEAAKQQQWLEEELKKARSSGDAQVVVFLHIPLFLERPDEPEQYFNWPLEARQRMLALLHQYSVNYVFAGHYHRNALGQDGQLQMTTTGPVSKPLGPDPSGVRFIEIDGRTLRSQYVGLGNFPYRESDLHPKTPLK
jgi:serine/threonine-protein phosphatase CPPED1